MQMQLRNNFRIFLHELEAQAAQQPDDPGALGCLRERYRAAIYQRHTVFTLSQLNGGINWHGIGFWARDPEAVKYCETTGHGLLSPSNAVISDADSGSDAFDHPKRARLDF